VPTLATDITVSLMLLGDRVASCDYVAAVNYRTCAKCISVF